MLKDVVSKDLSVFFNLDDFAEERVIDNKTIQVIIDNDRLKERTKKEYDDISVGEILYFCLTSDLEKPPKQGGFQLFGARQMEIFDCREDNGVSEIILIQNRSR